ncbi:MAG: ABC transporter permease [Gammaproteobacteria bacterium]|nr:ABC transporter permease [Gammaproteobacteria bacterium]
MPVVLVTDALIFLLVALVIAFALYTRRHEHLRAPWARVARSRLGMAAAVVLAWFVVIGLLESMHYHPRLAHSGETGSTVVSPEVLSVFDWLAAPLRTRNEKTYSAPFATRLFVRETVDLPGGGPARAFPRLRYAGAHLDDPDRGKWQDIGTSAAGAALAALLAWLVLVAFVVAGIARARAVHWRRAAGAVLCGRTEVPWHVLLATAGVLMVLSGVGARLAVDYHVFGTDKVGQDVLYQTLKSVRTGLVIGTLTTLVMLPFAIALGIMAGYFGRRVDDLIQYLYTTLNSIPSVLLIAAAVLMLHVYMSTRAEEFTSVAARADMRLLFLCLILGIMSWTGLCRLLRAETLKLREIDYIQAAHAFGVGHATIMMRHVLPNVVHIVMITVVLDFSSLVLAEAVLSYINIGVDPTMNSWGNMINSARLEMAREPVVWWSLAAAFVFMFALVLAANLFADAVRDAFDPRLRVRPA